MRDPDLVVRAQRAATALESAWCRWRNVHGLTTDPPPAVSSYVGYSLDAPWGEGRIVFGICAEEAEQLAEFLERHDCVGPIHASVTAMPADVTAMPRRPASTPPEAAAGHPVAAGLLNVPAPAPASAGQQPLPAGAVGSRHRDSLASRPRGAARDPDAPSPLTAPVAPETQDTETPIARAVSRALEAGPGRPDHPPHAAQRHFPGPGTTSRAGGSGLAGTVGAAVRSAGRIRRAAQPRPDGGAGRAARARRAGRGRHSGGHSTESAWVPWPERPGDTPAARPEPAIPEASGGPEVTAFRFRRPAAMTERARAVATAPLIRLARTRCRRRRRSGRCTWMRAAAMTTGITTVTGSRPRPDRDRIASAARHADAATWGASEVPGQAAVTDSAV